MHDERGRRPRIGVLRGATDFVQPEVAKNFEASLAVLARFADVSRDVALVDLPFGLCAGTIVDAEGGSAFLELIESGRLRELAAKSDRYGGYSSLMTPAVDYLHAMRLRERMRAPMAALLERYDALAAPARATTTSAARVPRSDSSMPSIFRIFSGTMGRNMSVLRSATIDSPRTVGW